MLISCFDCHKDFTSDSTSGRPRGVPFTCGHIIEGQLCEHLGKPFSPSAKIVL